MFFIYNSHPFYILCLEIDLRKNSHLRLLQFNFHLDDNGIRDEQNDVIGWFSSICESVTSRSLVVGLHGLFNESEICNKIQDVLLALHTRIETLSIFLFGKDRWGEQTLTVEDLRKLFSRLYEAGIVVEKWLGWNGNEVVSGYFLTSNLPILTMFMLSVPLLSVGSFALQSPLLPNRGHVYGSYQVIVQFNIWLHTKSFQFH